MKKIKIGDTIKVLAGKDKGKTGKVIQVFPHENKVAVEGVNIIKKHLRTRTQGQKGQILELSAPMAVSNVALLCSHCERGVRVGFRVEGKSKTRVCKKCNNDL
ncbi:MAG: 50S ribosomal protein L24 [Candidatus Magasanikbacteria bacterium]|nr:50S ribosomal protein L24 [Candidatus Magasanikbacteria bacterium]